MPAIVIRRAPGSIALRARSVCSLAERMLEALELSDWELSVMLSNDAIIHELNREHRNKDRPTDVLSFPQYDPFPPSPQQALPTEERLLGDIVISLDTAQKQARQRRHELLDEVTFLLAHGLLHLIGYDHQNDREEKIMDAATKKLVHAASGAGARGAARKG